MYTLEKKEYIDGEGWTWWKTAFVFDYDNSENPKLDALLEFEETESTPRIIWRVVNPKGKVLIEQR